MGTNFGEIWIWIRSFAFKKMHMKISSAKMAAILSRDRWVKIYIERINDTTTNEIINLLKKGTYNVENCHISYEFNRISQFNTHHLGCPPVSIDDDFVRNIFFTNICNQLAWWYYKCTIIQCTELNHYDSKYTSLYKKKQHNMVYDDGAFCNKYV